MVLKQFKHDTKDIKKNALNSILTFLIVNTYQWNRGQKQRLVELIEREYKKNSKEKKK